MLFQRLPRWIHLHHAAPWKHRGDTFHHGHELLMGHQCGSSCLIAREMFGTVRDALGGVALDLSSADYIPMAMHSCLRKKQHSEERNYGKHRQCRLERVARAVTVICIGDHSNPGANRTLVLKGKSLPSGAAGPSFPSPSVRLAPGLEWSPDMRLVVTVIGNEQPLSLHLSSSP